MARGVPEGMGRDEMAKEADRTALRKKQSGEATKRRAIQANQEFQSQFVDTTCQYLVDRRSQVNTHRSS